jgi:exopolysaccharide biosynthesis protein
MSTSPGLRCPEHASIMVQAGATSVIALDGGGSSMMYIKGQGNQIRPSDGSERVVGNFLGAYALGSGPSPHCPTQ